MLFNGISDGWLVVFHSNVSLCLHANFSDIGDWLPSSYDNQVDNFFEIGLTNSRESYLSESIDGCYFKVEAGLFTNDIR